MLLSPMGLLQTQQKKGGTFKIWLWLYKHTRTQYQTTAATNVTKAHQ